jgi:hypothetical protein
MQTNFAKALLTASACTAVLFTAARAQAAFRAEPAEAHAELRHTGPRDPFTDGARTLQRDRVEVVVAARQGLQSCSRRAFDPYRDGMRNCQPDINTGGDHAGARDAFTDGALSAESEKGNASECLSALWPSSVTRGEG